MVVLSLVNYFFLEGCLQVCFTVAQMSVLHEVKLYTDTQRSNVPEIHHASWEFCVHDVVKVKVNIPSLLNFE